MVILKLSLIVSIVCGCMLAVSSDFDDLTTRDGTFDAITAAGYRAERHHVVTSDGYILEMHRIPFKRGMSDGDPARPVVFLMHGLVGASSTFVHLGFEYAIGFNVADSGCDVWIGNARGNRLSRFHVSMDADHPDDRRNFFDFSWEEIGMLDVAAMVDYTLVLTGKQQLHYIGHSQGGTAFLVLNSMRPEYNEKFTSVHLLAAVAYTEYFPNSILLNLSRFTTEVYNFALELGIVEIFPPMGSIIGTLDTGNIATTNSKKYQVSDYCTGDPAMKDLCVLMGVEEFVKQNSNSVFGAGSSFKQFAHYGQNIRDKLFRRWDYGPEENYERYGTIDPPIYNISLITADVIMHYSVSDALLHERDVIAMANDMPNAVVRRVARDSFAHTDFHSAIDARELVTEYMIEYIWNVESGTDDGGGNNNVSGFNVLNTYLSWISLFLVTIRGYLH